ncbi:MAG: Hsp70 family protein [Planctomycetes bacterium]|nr:Hsp70 family protein [Planctomycetota bacterium]
MDSELKRDFIIGIDLGTTNSEVAVVEDGRPRIIRGENHALRGILPSIVGLDAEGKLLIGEPARNQMLHAPERTVCSIKRKMGSAEKVRLGDVDYTPQEISALILRHLADRAEQHLGSRVRRAVITVPAYFNDTQRQATREAGELAGIEVVRLLHEPTAASLVYEADRLAGGAAGDAAGGELRRLLVYDLGGGTFDVSIVEIHGGVVEVRASHGDTHLGGDDFDQLLLDHVAGRFLEKHGVDLRAVPSSRARLLRAVEAVKCALSTRPYASLQEEFIVDAGGRPLHLSMEIDRKEYEDLIRPLVERSMQSVQTALHDAGWLARDLDEIILVGGSTRTPLVQEELKSRTGLEPRFEVDPDLCVAMGAATQAAMISGEDVHSVLVDITPHSFGIRCLSFQAGGAFDRHFSRVIPKGTPLPTTRSEVYYTFMDDQEAAEIEVYQGEASTVDQNTKLGTFMVQDLEPAPSGSPIVVDFHLNLDGILKVKATEKATGRQNHIVIDDALHSFSEEERREAQERIDRILRPQPSTIEEEEEEDEGEEKEAARSEAALRSVGAGEGSEDAAGFESRIGSEPSRGVKEVASRLESEEIRETIRKVRERLAEMVREDREEAVQWIEEAQENLAAGRLDVARKAHRELEEILFFVEEG